jgi:putative SOS response-associated peptidase YedK
MGFDPALVPGSERRPEADQCQGRDGHEAADLSGGLQIAPVQGGKQPYAIAMKNGSPFGLAGLWENWKDPATGDWVRTFTIITLPSNELVGRIHDRMPAILRPHDYQRWLGPDPDPRDLMVSFPSELLRMWPISKRVNKPENNDPAILEPIDLAC